MSLRPRFGILLQPNAYNYYLYVVFQGYFCPENIAQPEYCCEGYYCPPDLTATPINSDGLGAWGAVVHNILAIFVCVLNSYFSFIYFVKIEKCPKDYYCMTGNVDPFDCPPLSTCEAGSTKANKSASIILLVFLVLIIYAFFLFRYALQARRRRFQDSILTEEANKDKKRESKNGNFEAFDVDSAGKGSNGNLKEALVDSRETKTPFLIQFENLGLKLKTGVRVMEGVNGEFQPGRMCAVMGSSG